MSGKSDLLTSIVVAVAGIVMICFYQRIDILAWIVILIGAMFLIPGIFSLILGMRKRENGGSTTQVIAGIGASALGAIMVIMPEAFAGVIVYIFAALLVVGGIYHIVYIAWLSRPFVLPFYYYILPVLMIVAGIVLLTTNIRTLNNVVVLITGISFVAWSLSSLLEWIATHPTQTKDHKEIKE